MSNRFVKHIKPGIWFIAGHGLCKGPVGLSYNKATRTWSLNSRIHADKDLLKFADEDYCGDTFQSFSAVLEHVSEGRCLRKLETEERISKVTCVDMCGVSYYRGADGRHRYGVSNPLGGGTTVYIGTDDTWRANINSAFDKAVDIRHGYEREHTVKSYWSFQSCNITEQG